MHPEPGAAVARATLSLGPTPIGYRATQQHLAAATTSGDGFAAGPPTAHGEDLTVEPTTLRQRAGVPEEERSPTRLSPAGPPPLPPAPAPMPASEEDSPGSRVDKALKGSVLVVGALVVALAAWLLVVHLRPGTSPSTSPSTAAHGAASAKAHTRPTTSAPSGSQPEITSITPDRGAAGQVVMVTGVNLFSADGRVQVFFGGQGAPTSCSSETTCQATVTASSPGKVRVTVVTEAGTSNGLTFRAT